MITPKQTPVSSGELMIGNILQYQSGTTLMQGFVTSIPNGKKICISHVPIKIENVIGVKLSPEILNRCGFVQKTGIMCWTNEIDESLEIAYETLAGHFRLYPRTHKIKYLHQLQNLYFLLCGKHLEVKL